MDIIGNRERKKLSKSIPLSLLNSRYILYPLFPKHTPTLSSWFKMNPNLQKQKPIKLQPPIESLPSIENDGDEHHPGSKKIPTQIHT